MINNNGLYRKKVNFKPHTNNASQPVNATDINNIQEAIKGLQGDNLHNLSKSFKDDCLFILNNNELVNYMFYFDFAVQDNILRDKSNNYTVDPMNKCIKITNGQVGAVIHTTALKSTYSNTINDYMIKSDTYIPMGANIRYSISNDMSNYYPITVNNSIPMKLDIYHENIYVKIELVPNMRGETPLLFALCLFCIDGLIDKDITTLNPDFVNPPIDTTIDGDVILIYDTTGRLMQVKRADATQTVDLVWGTDDSLSAINQTNVLNNKLVELIRDNDGMLKTIRTKTTKI